jgi:hypothetical protein
MRIHENYPKMAELLRLVSYYNLPRYLAWISIAKYLGIFVLQESIDWFSKEILSRKQCFLPPLCGFCSLLDKRSISKKRSFTFVDEAGKKVYLSSLMVDG